MADARVGIQELREATGAIIDRVERGETITVTRRGRPVARLLGAEGTPRVRPVPGVRVGEGYPYMPNEAKGAAVSVTAFGRVPRRRR